MPSSAKTVHVRHSFQGGWATDFGPNASLADNRSVTGEDGIPIPYLTTAEDIRWKLNGGWQKEGGVRIANSTVVSEHAASQTDFRNIADYWRDVSGTPTQQVVGIVGDSFHHYTMGQAAWTEVTTVNTGNGNVVNFAVLDNDLYIADDGGNAPLQWNGSTLAAATNWGTNVPAMSFLETHKNYLFGAGVKATPSTLFFSPTLGASSRIGDDWTAGGADGGGQFEISPEDGDRIMALVSFRDSLFIFKGPNIGSIWRVTGSQMGGPASDAQIINFASGIGCVGANATFRFANDVGFLWQHGTVHSLATTERFGDFERASLSVGLNDGFLRDQVNNSSLDRAWAFVDDAAGVAYIGIPIQASSDINCILKMDFRFQPNRWSYSKSISNFGDHDSGIIPAIGGAYIIDASISDRPTPMIAGSDGFLRKLEQNNKWFEITPPSGTGEIRNIKPVVETPFLSYGSTFLTKTLMSASISARVLNSSIINFSWSRDSNASQSVDIVTTGGNQLGAAPPENEFIIGNPVMGTLGGDRLSPLYQDLADGGEFRQISYKISNDQQVPDVEIDDFSVQFTYGADTLEDL